MPNAAIKISLTTILLSGLLVGTLDILSAFADVYITYHRSPLGVLNYIARGAFGKSELAARNRGMLFGLLFHYIIAFAFTFLFFGLYNKLKLYTINRAITGIVYGLFIWAVMNFIVVRSSNIDPLPPFKAFNLIKAALILILMMGLPLSYIAYSNYNAATKKSYT